MADALIAIVGGSCAGKTWLAGELKRMLGKEAECVALDSFYRDRSHLSPPRRERVNFDHPRSVDWAAVEAALRSAMSGRPFEIPEYDYERHTRAGMRRIEKAPRILLVEGLWLLRRPSIRRLFDLSIFLECPEQVRLERRLIRDAGERARGEESIRRQFLQVTRMHARYVAPQARWADLVLVGSIGDERVEALAMRIRELAERRQVR